MTKMAANDPGQAWRQHFSKSAADLLQICACLAGFDLQDVILRCFKRSKAAKVTEPTLLAVLQDISDESEGKAEAVARRMKAVEAFMAERAKAREAESK